jgi:hypothetical protein
MESKPNTATTKRQGNSLVSLTLALSIPKFPSPLAPVAASSSKPRYEFLHRAPDLLRFIRSPTPIAGSPAAEPWIYRPQISRVVPVGQLPPGGGEGAVREIRRGCSLRVWAQRFAVVGLLGAEIRV